MDHSNPLLSGIFWVFDAPTTFRIYNSLWLGYGYFLQLRARNNSRSMDTVRTDLGVDRSTFHLASHVDQSFDRFENEMN